MDSSVAPQGGVAPYKHCLNCGAELMGGYCHQCGQHASDPVPRIGGFVAEYLNNAFIWDPLFFPTLWKLISRPGFLTREFMSGKFIAYEHPLKINMFFMFVFLSIFVIFTDVDELHNNYTKLVANEDVTAYIVASSLLDKEGYAASLKYFKVDYIPVSERMYYEYADELLAHIRELVELENGINFTGNAEVGIVLTEDELAEFIANGEAFAKCRKLYMGHDLLPDEEQEKILRARGVEISIIPDYYYRDLQEG